MSISVLNNNLKKFGDKSYFDNSEEVCVDQSITITNSKQKYYTATNTEQVTVELSFTFTDLINNGLRIPIGFTDEDIDINYYVRYGKNVISIKKILYPGDFVRIYSYRYPGLNNLPSITANLRITSKTLQET